MSGEYLVRKFVRRVRNEGPMAAGLEGITHLQRVANGILEGKRGYHRLQLRRLSRKYDIETISPVWVSPHDIDSLTGSYVERDDGHLDYNPYFKPDEASWDTVDYEREVPYGTVLGGKWDQERPSFEKLLIFRGVEQHYIEELPWEETVYYQRLRRRFETSEWNEDEASKLAAARCERIDTLHDALTTDGYQSQQSLNGHPLHEVTVNVARDGELLYNSEGRHRLSLAKVLDIDQIPVLVLVRHEDFTGQSLKSRKMSCEPTD